MEYKGFSIEKNNRYIIIKNIDGVRIYASEIYTDDINEVYEIGKKIIDLGIDIINETNKSEYLSFQSIYKLNEANEVRRYKVNPEGIELKAKLRNEYKNNQGKELLINIILLLLTIFLMGKKSDSYFIIILLSNIIITFLSVISFRTSLYKEDYEKIKGSKIKKALTYLLFILVGKGYLLSSVKDVKVVGPRIKYVMPILVIRILTCIMLLDFIGSSTVNFIICIITIFINILFIKSEIKNLKIIEKYKKINEDGVSDFESPIF